MDNLEKILEDIRIADVEPDEMLVRRTKSVCNKYKREERQAELASTSRKSRLTVQLLAAAAFVAFLFVALVVSSIRSQNPIDGAAYYTLDINPSLGFTVDQDSNVIDVTLQNADAKELYKGMDLIGLKLEQALSLVIQAAQQKGYLNSDNEKFILLGQFMEGMPEEKGNEILNQLMLNLQTEVGDEVHIIGLKGDKKDLEEAEELEVSPGILVLCELAGDVEAGEDVKVADVVDKLPDEYKSQPEFSAPVISASAENDMLVISWNAIDFSQVTTEGAEVEYKLLKGTTLEEIKEMKNVAVSLTLSLDEDQPHGFFLDVEADDLNKQMYYCLYVHSSNTSKVSNVLPVTAQAVMDGTTPQPQATPVPIDDEEAPEIEATIDGDYITINWSKVEENDRFDGYKVMYSASDSTPVYGEEGCYYLEFVTDINKTSGKYKLSSLKGYEEGKKYYFSITALYDGQKTKIPGDVLSRVMPVTTAQNTPEPTDEPATEYPSTNISGERDGNVFYLSWNKISDSRLEGYKVVYSFTDSTPVYGENSYVRWITNSSTTSTTVNVSELGEHSEGNVYFSITALYNDHSVKKAGNSVKLSTPGYVPEPYVGTSVSASYSESTGKVTVNWTPVAHPSFEGYKVVYSLTDSTPVYGESGTEYFAWITDAATTSASMNVADYAGETMYFSVTVLYNNHNVKKAGNSVTINVPAETTPTYTAANLTSASYLGDGQFKLTWSTVDNPDFTEYAFHYSINGAGYTEYGEEVNMTTSNKTLTLSVNQGDEVKFKIVTYYNSDYSNGYWGSTIKTVNVPEETTPDPTPTPTAGTLTADGGTVSFNWTCDEHTGFLKYKVYYKINDGTESSDIITDYSTKNWSHTFAEYADGDTVTVRVVAYYDNGDSNGSGSKTINLIMTY